MDVLKSALGFLVGGLITSIFLARCDAQRQRDTFTWQAWYGLKVAAMGDLARASAKFSVNAADALHAKACQKPLTAAQASSDRGAPTILAWQDDNYDDVEIAERSVSGAFSRVEAVSAARLGKELSTVHAYRNALLDLLNHVGEESCEPAAWEKFRNAKLLPIRDSCDKAAQILLEDLRAQLGPG